MLEELDVPYQVEIVRFGPSMKTEEYLSINPMGKVPAIKFGDTIVTETLAICSYLADYFPDKELSPPLDQRSDYYRWLFFTAACLDPMVVISANKIDVVGQNKGPLGFGTL